MAWSGPSAVVVGGVEDVVVDVSCGGEASPGVYLSMIS